MLENGTRVNIRRGTHVGQDLGFIPWENEDIVFTIAMPTCHGRYRLVAPGYGGVPYGNGAVFADEEFLTPVTEVSDEELALRKLLFFSHGCPPHGDDGEMQCHACGVDFKRMTAAEIDAAWFKRALEARAKEALDAKSDSSHPDADVSPLGGA